MGTMRRYANRPRRNPTYVTPDDKRSDPTRSAQAGSRAAQDDVNNQYDVQTEVADVEAPPQPIVRRGGTFGSFRHRGFVWFWFGALVSNVGTWMQAYALGIVVFAFRQSEFDLGLINFISGIPVLFLAIAGGALADRVDRRKLLIWIQLVLIAQAAALGLLYNSGRLSSANVVTSLAWVAALGVVAGVFSALQFPAWQAMVPDLVPTRIAAERDRAQLRSVPVFAADRTARRGCPRGSGRGHGRDLLRQRRELPVRHSRSVGHPSQSGASKAAERRAPTAARSRRCLAAFAMHSTTGSSACSSSAPRS